MENFDHRSILVDSGTIVHCSFFDDFWKTPVINQKFCSIKASLYMRALLDKAGRRCAQGCNSSQLRKAPHHLCQTFSLQHQHVL